MIGTFSLGWTRMLFVCGLISVPFAVILLAVHESGGFDISSWAIVVLWLSLLALTSYLWRHMRACIAQGRYTESDFYNNPFKIVVTFLPALGIWILVTTGVVLGLLLWMLRTHL